MQSSSHLPIQFQSIYDPIHLKLNYLGLIVAGEKMSGLFGLIYAQQNNLEEVTREQTTSKLWMRFCAGRITASHLYQVVHSDPHKPSISLVNATYQLFRNSEICYKINFIWL